MTKSIQLTDSEMELMDILWQQGPHTARQVMEKLSHKQLAYSTIITLLQRMENKGALTSRKGDVGKALIFEPAVKPGQVQKQAVKSLLQRYFQNDPITVFSTLVETKKLKPGEIEQIRSMLDEMENRQ